MPLPTPIPPSSPTHASTSAPLLPPCSALQLTVNAKGSFTAESQQAARSALGGGSVDDVALRQALLAAAEAELASKPTSAADDERLLQVGRGGVLAVGLCGA